MMEVPTNPLRRIVFLIIALVGLLVASKLTTGSLIPSTQHHSLIFQNGLLLIVLGSALIEHKFTKPVDSLINSLFAILTMVSAFNDSPPIWWVIFAYCVCTLVLSSICISVSTGPFITGWRKSLAFFSYKPAVFLGNSRMIFSIVFLYGIYAYYDTRSNESVILLVFWGLLIIGWTSGILGASTNRLRNNKTPSGLVIRTDWPNIVHAEIDPKTTWDVSSTKIYQRSDGQQEFIIPLYKVNQNGIIVGTGLCSGINENHFPSTEEGYIYDYSTSNEIDCIYPENSETLPCKIGGYVVEGSTIDEILFETWNTEQSKEGRLVWCQIGKHKVYFQITNGQNREEAFQANRHGFQVATAVQLGRSTESGRFEKYPWLPTMNSPVFFENEDYGEDLFQAQDGDFEYGVIPNSKIKIFGPFRKGMPYHTAVLGVTGSGKTELALRMIRKAVSDETKVVCIDLTGQYLERLADLKPINLSIPNEDIQELEEKIFDIETGKFGGPEEKKILKKHVSTLRDTIYENTTEFINSDNNLGLIYFPEISNTKATLYLTEIYLSSLLNYAKKNFEKCPHILIAIEEAHTIIPETSTMGVDGYDAKALVGKISQIALQGRKYGVGVLVVAQRTATVSKSVLTQCNTVISFSCYDETSIGFLSNVFGRTLALSLANMPRFHAIAYGNSVRSDRPLMIKVLKE